MTRRRRSCFMAAMDLLATIQRIRDRIASPTAYTFFFDSLNSEDVPGHVFRDDAARWSLEGAARREAVDPEDAATLAHLEEVHARLIRVAKSTGLASQAGLGFLCVDHATALQILDAAIAELTP